MTPVVVFVLAVTAWFRPAHPTIGDVVAVEFRDPAASSVKLEPSPAFEIVSQRGPVILLRPLEPHPIALAGRVGGMAFHDLVLPVHSVLPAGDNPEPAPLRPPVAGPPSTNWLYATAVALAVSAIAWSAVLLLARRARRGVEELASMRPVDRFRAAVADLQRKPSARGRWAALADATRLYLASAGTAVGSDLTSAEALRLIGSLQNELLTATIATILRQGDLEKFSPWGAGPGDFPGVATGALAIPDAFEPADVREGVAA